MFHATTSGGVRTGDGIDPKACLPGLTDLGVHR